MITLTEIKEGIRFFRRSLSFKGFRHYSGNDREICRQIISDCFNGEYFRTGLGNFNEFYSRDFGICVESLMKLGYEKEVRKTLEFALDVFKNHGTVEQSISPSKKAFSFPIRGPDSLTFLIRSMRIAGTIGLIEQNKDFLNSEIRRFKHNYLDEKTGLAKKGHFTSMKDNAVRYQSCYDTCMIGMLSGELKKIKILDNPFSNYDFKDIIQGNYWNGDYFYDDMAKKDYIAGDANVFPFWSGIFDEKDRFLRVLNAIQSEGLDAPFPLKYTGKMIHGQYILTMNALAPNYVGTTIWPHLGLCYIQVVSRYSPILAARYLKKYEELILLHKNFTEVYNPDGTPYDGYFYKSDEGMLWSSIYLELVSHG